jgi:CelD/BcsL family acetyltransferase involved in cellulose biosynthesis
MRIEILNTMDAIKNLMPAWRRLAASSPVKDIFLMPEWYLSYWKTLPEGMDVRVLLFWANDELSGILPIRFSRRGPFKIIRFFGQPHFIHRSDFILSPEKNDECLKAFVQWLNSRNDWDMVEFKNFSMFSDHAEMLKKHCEFINLKCKSIEGSLNYYLPNRSYENFDDYWQSYLSKRDKKRFRHMRNRLKKIKTVSWKNMDRIHERLWNRLMEIDQNKKFQHEIDRSYFSFPGKALFFNELSKFIQPPVQLQIITLSIEDQLASYIIGFSYAEKLFLYQTAYNSKFYRVSPGVQSLLKAIKIGFNSGMQEIDLLMGDQEYKTNFKPESRRAENLMIFNRRLPSVLLKTHLNWFKPMSRKLKQKFPVIEKQLVKYKRKKIIHDGRS